MIVLYTDVSLLMLWLVLWFMIVLYTDVSVSVMVHDSAIHRCVMFMICVHR